MNNRFKFLAAAAVVAGFALPAAAEDMDLVYLNCGTFLNMDDGGKIATATNLLNWIVDANNAEMAGNLVGQFDKPEKTTPLELVQKVQERCTDKPYTTNIVARLQDLD